MRGGLLGVALLALVLSLSACGRTARDGGGETATLPTTTPVASAIVASVADSATAPSTAAPTTGEGAGEPSAVTDAEDDESSARLADIVTASIEQRAGTLTVRIVLARPLDVDALGDDAQIVVGAYLLANPDDVDPFAARVLIDAGKPPRFLFGPWLGAGKQIDGTLDDTELTLIVPSLVQGRFRYAQFFAEDPAGSETLPDDAAGLVAINAE